MNLDSVKQTFLIESEELLDRMEVDLLNLEKNPEDSEAVNSLFRAIHTIKGSAGMFGYDNIVNFTHSVESMLEQLRKGEADINPDLIAALLKSHDHVQQLIAIDTSEDSEMTDGLAAEGNELLAELKAHFSGTFTPPPAASASTADAPVATAEGEGVANPNWHISIRLNKEVLTHGLDPAAFINYLKTMGDLINVRPVADQLPSLSEYDPESFYTGFEIDLSSESSADEIEANFEFLEDDSDIIILPPHAAIAAYRDLISNRPEDDERIRNILIEMGSLQKSELDEKAAAPAPSEKAAAETGVQKSGSQTAAKNAPAGNAARNAAAGNEQAKKFIRIEAGKLDHLINLVGELVITGATIRQLSEKHADADLSESASAMSRLIEELRDNVMNVRMVQIGETFRRFERIVRDTSRELGKQIQLKIKGGDTELDKNLIDNIADPLMHLVRNSMDHGLEMPDERAEAGKPRQGTINLNSYHDTGSIVIEVSDDGKGLDRDVLLNKAIERGIANPNNNYSDHDIYHFIFEPGFSTAAEVTNISGRGVGMDVVKRNIESLRGTVDVSSKPGRGTTVRIRLPLTLAIIDGFLVTVGKTYYVIPLDMVIECVEMDNSNEGMASGGNMINLRGEVLPYMRLSDFFDIELNDSQHENIIVVKYAQQKAGLLVDDLLGESQTVIKPLGKLFDKLQGISGATIMGTGEVALILDVPRLIEYAIASQE